MKRFCCNPVEYRPLTVDPTFDFGPYNVTPISYQHLIVLRREDGKHPTMIGPVLLHEKKTQSTYSLFGGTLKSLEPELKNLMAFGTDDEKVLVGGFNETFERATCLPYEIHLCKNIDTKLLSMDIKGESKQSVMDDIFGRKIGSVFESRLSDAGSAQNLLACLKVWRKSGHRSTQMEKPSSLGLARKKRKNSYAALLVPFVRELASVAHQTNSQPIDLNAQTVSFRTA